MILRRIIIIGTFLLLSFTQSSFSQTFNENSSRSIPLLHWKISPQDKIGRDSLKIFNSNYEIKSWINAKVPGTVFGAYVQAGIEKNPNYADNIYKVNKSKYDRNFWYRTTFITPKTKKNKRVWLNFDGINRKGLIILNGVRLGFLDGFMERGEFDITNLLNTNKKNVLGVLVYCPQRPIPNYASPTYISSDGWDWMPSVPGLDMGITDSVYLKVTGDIKISDPWIRTQVPSLDTAILSIATTVANSSNQNVKGVLQGMIRPGNISFSQEIELDAQQKKSIRFDTTFFKQLLIRNPQLWWPNGYGKPNLYKCNLKFKIDGDISDHKNITFGIREYSYDTTGNVFHLLVNGKRVFIKGGNWGMSEYMLRCRGSEYNLKVKLHKKMHLNMIRNWIGSVTDEAFYDACDKYGIMVWDDFWLNSHPNLPRDIFAFNKNAVEKIKRLRNHPSIAVWCGDNEGYPLPPLDDWLRADVQTFDGGDRWYQSNSHADNLTGSGPWTNFDPQWYFTKYPGGFGGNDGYGLRTEIGTAVFPTFASFRKFIPKEDWWPKNEMWDKHFFGSSAANASPKHYMESIDKEYGKATGIKDFCRKAQLLNIETNKALFEGWQQHMWDDASGVMLWMSQPAYPSMVWQTYDYYYDLTGAYWGVKKACEPLHIQWSYANNSVKVINTTSKNYRDLKASAIVYNLSGEKTGLGKSIELASSSNTASKCFTLNFDNDNLAFGKDVKASSVSEDAGGEDAITDGSNGSRWSSKYSDNQWIYVDLGKKKEFSTIVLVWEAAYAKAYKLQISDDAKNWRDVYKEANSEGGTETIHFDPVRARYIRMFGLKRATRFGYSLYELKVYKKKISLSPKVQFIRLFLKDKTGKLLSDNFYWRSSRGNDYTALNKLSPVELKVSSSIKKGDEQDIIRAVIKNPVSSKYPAFAIHVQAIRGKDGERILPAMMNDNYFTLMPGEAKEIKIKFDKKLLKGEKYKLNVIPYNNKL